MRRELKLPTGKVASVKARILGRDQQHALRMIGKDSVNFPFAMVAVCAEVDGKALTMEDVLDLDYHDVEVLQGAVLGRGTATPTSGETP